MRRFYAILITSFCLAGADAQNLAFVKGLSSVENRADKAFGQFSYHNAALLFEQAYEVEGNHELLWKAGESYYKLNDPFQAELKFRQAINVSDSLPPHYQLIYAQVLTSNQKYDEALVWFNSYSGSNQSDARAQNRISGLEELNDLYEDSAFYVLKRLNINSRSKDFSPAFTQNGIAFISSRRSNDFVKSVFNWDQSSYLDIYSSNVREDGSMGQPQMLTGKVNSKLHEGPLSFYDGGRKMVFTRNNFYKGKSRRSSDGINRLQLFFGEYDSAGYTWKNVVPFEYNSKEYSTGHPAITEDGNKMYFTSDMDGGVGGTDIYVTEFIDGKWQVPTNVESVNTEGNEMFPYLSVDGTLYFSSDGHHGLGGLDIYKMSPGNEEIKNLGAPINSSYDDFGLIATAGAKSGYFSSNRLSKSADDDLFKFSRLMRGIEVIVKDASTDKVIVNAEISLFDQYDNLKSTTKSSALPAGFELSEPGEITILAKRQGYESRRLVINNSDIKPGYIGQAEMLLQPTSPLPSHGELIVNGDKGFIGVQGEMLEFKWNKDKCYLLKGTEKIWLPNCSIDSDKPLEFTIKENLVDNGINLLETPEDLVFKNIYYDYDEALVRIDASPELQKLALIMNKYGDSKVMLRSFTDSRGSFEYNKNLSSERSKAAVEFLRNQGISEDRIAPAHFGELFPVVECPEEDDCTEDEHQLNRRTEIVLDLK
ncbi:MAG: OmpA family protein [Cyclobacteriaceae bacterium]